MTGRGRDGRRSRKTGGGRNDGEFGYDGEDEECAKFKDKCMR
jgi:hypothetical protein